MWTNPSSFTKIHKSPHRNLTFCNSRWFIVRLIVRKIILMSFFLHWMYFMNLYFMLPRLSDSQVILLFSISLMLLVTLESDWRTSASLCSTWFYIIIVIESRASWFAFPDQVHISVHIHVNWMYFHNKGRKHGLIRTHWRTVNKIGLDGDWLQIFFSTFLSLIGLFCTVLWLLCLNCLFETENIAFWESRRQDNVY